MKTILLLVLLSILAVMGIWLSAPALGEAEANIPTSSSIGIFSENGELKTYTESHSWGVKTTATVTESPCLTCLKHLSLDDCKTILDVCLDVNKD